MLDLVEFDEISARFEMTISDKLRGNDMYLVSTVQYDWLAILGCGNDGVSPWECDDHRIG